MTARINQHQKCNHSGFCWSKRWGGIGITGPYANHLHFAPDRYHASTSPLSFYRPGAPPDTQPTASKHWGCIVWRKTVTIIGGKIFFLCYNITVEKPSAILSSSSVGHVCSASIISTTASESRETCSSGLHLSKTMFPYPVSSESYYSQPYQYHLHKIHSD